MNSAARALRFWNTVRHLKLKQVTGRARFRLLRPAFDPGAPELSPRAVTGWVQPAARLPSMTGPDSFCFLNHAVTAPGWNDPAQEKLWLYNLHYFDDLNADGAAARTPWHRDLVAQWIAQNPPVVGNGWEPYPTSLRIVNWIKWALAGNPLSEPARTSLALQARWLGRRLEWHLLGNHLFANAKALVLAGLFLEGREAAGWLSIGLDIVARELPEQILPDGGNFERSPMYHALFLEDVLDLINGGQAFPGLVPTPMIEEWRATAARMLAWMQIMTHPDGEIALFNDAAFGIAPAPAALAAYARRLGLVAPAGGGALRHLPDSGYIRLEAGDAVALLDVAPVGPDCLPGHAHADTLSFELSLKGQRLVVNGGTSRYGSGPERQRERQTAAHSTVEVAGQDSSEVWDGFRVARRAYPRDLKISNDKKVLSVTCAHDGYQRLPGRPLHRRGWCLTPMGLTVTDTVTNGAPSVARFILHPGVTIEPASDGQWRLRLPDGTGVTVMIAAGDALIREARYAPEFGVTRETRCLAVTLRQGRAETQFDWGPQA